MTMKQILKGTNGRTDPCPHCRCYSIRVPKDGSPPFCVYDRCPNAWTQDPALRSGRANLRAVQDDD